MRNRFKVVLFDLGNTLLFFEGDWDHVIEQAVRNMEQVLKEHKVLNPRIDFSLVFSNALKQYYITRDVNCVETTTSVLLRDLLLSKYDAAIDDKTLSLSLNAFYHTTGKHWKLDEYSLDTLQTLSTEGYKIGLVSNASHAPDVYQQIDDTGLSRYLEVVITSAEAGIRKPHPKIFELALEQLQCKPEDAVMVGDTLNADILGSRRMGMKNVWVRRWTSPVSTHTYDDGIIPDKTIQYLFELPPLLEWWK